MSNVARLQELLAELRDVSNLAETDLLKVVGKNIKRERNQVGITQEHIARMADISRTQLTNIEAGKDTTVGRLFLIAHAIGCPVENLVKEES